MAVDWLSDVKKYVANVDEMAVAGIVRYCGIALRNRDSSLVAFSDSTETDRVRTNFLKKKLALTDSDDVLDGAIAAVGEKMKGDRSKNRVTVYYLLAENFGKLAMFAVAPKSKAAAKPKADGAAKVAGAAAAGAVAGAAAASAAKPKTAKAAKSAAATPAPAKPAPAKKAAATPAPAKPATAKKVAAKPAPAKPAPAKKTAATGAAAASGAKAAKLVSTTKTSAAKPPAASSPAPAASDGVESGGTLGGAAAAIGGAAAAGAAAAGAAAVGLVGGGASGTAAASGGGSSTGGAAASGGSAAGSAGSGGSAAASGGGGGGQKFADVPDEGGGSGFKWWWLLLLLFALLLAFVLLKSCMHQPAPLANSSITDGNTTDDSMLGGNDMTGDNAMASAASAPAGAGIVASAPAGLPMLTVYFATGKADVTSDFAAQAAELKAYLAAHPDAKLRVSGYNDPSGNAAVNAALSKKRAQAVAAALTGAGIAEGSVVLEKPADTTIAGADASAARRVEVTIKQ